MSVQCPRGCLGQRYSPSAQSLPLIPPVLSFLSPCLSAAPSSSPLNVTPSASHALSACPPVPRHGSSPHDTAAPLWFVCGMPFSIICLYCGGKCFPWHHKMCWGHILLELHQEISSCHSCQFCVFFSFCNMRSETRMAVGICPVLPALSSAVRAVSHAARVRRGMANGSALFVCPQPLPCSAAKLPRRRRGDRIWPR